MLVRLAHVWYLCNFHKKHTWDIRLWKCQVQMHLDSFRSVHNYLNSGLNVTISGDTLSSNFATFQRLRAICRGIVHSKAHNQQCSLIRSDKRTNNNSQ